MEINKKWTLGVEYENMKTLMKKSGIKTHQGINYRIRSLKKRGTIIKSHYDDDRKVFWLKEDADKFINCVFTRERKK